ncbi:MAG: hypothetical protein R3D32_08010 [Nitratireductor sp.]
MANLLHRLNKVKWEAHRPFIHGSGRISDNLSEGLDAHRLGDYETAISIVQKLPDWKQDPLALRIVGHAMLGLDRYEEALAAHRAARDLRDIKDRGRVEDEVNIASVYVGQKNYTEALEALKRALSLEPGYVPATLGKIAVLNRQQRETELRELLINITRDQPTFWSDETVNRFLDTDTDMLRIKQIVAQIAILED